MIDNLKLENIDLRGFRAPKTNTSFGAIKCHGALMRRVDKLEIEKITQQQHHYWNPV